MRLKDIIAPEAIALHAAAKDQLDAISKLVDLQEKNGKMQDKGSYRSAIYAREDITSTALDGGIAIPHAKSAVITSPCVCFATLENGVDWMAYDHSLSDLIFMIGAPMEGDEHLRLLTYITTLLTEDPELADKLRAASTAEDIYALLSAAEEACFGAE